MGVLKGTFREFIDDDCPRLAAALSYYTIFALPPLLILILMVVSVFTDPQDVQGRLVDEISGVMGEQAAGQISAMIEQAERPEGSGVATILSIAALLFGATGAFFQLQKALNTAWDVEPEEGGVKSFAVKRAVSFGMIIAIAFLLLVSLVVSAVLSQAADAIASVLPAALSTVMLWAINLGLSLAVITLLFAAMFKVLPDARVAWRDVWVGAGVTAALFILGMFLMGFYMSRSDPGSAYGAAGSLAVVLIWVYVSSLILFLGAEFTQVFARRHGKRIEPDEGAVRASAAEAVS